MTGLENCSKCFVIKIPTNVWSFASITKRVPKVSAFLVSSFYSDLQNVQMPEEKLDNVLILFLIKTCLEQKSCADLHFRPFYQGSEHLSLTFHRNHVCGLDMNFE